MKQPPVMAALQERVSMVRAEVSSVAVSLQNAVQVFTVVDT